ncbi:acetylornithine deacetylase/succinyldiaminopimelate desuccinylase-like deacylase [Thaumarchaeota archaeon SCGC AB-539-E09]|nr:acetylornithine deacetylase/succinyldiaminopimelate desuccinylase-like deacylase [Thaumarchaeota archaeon SCGC AB-539-E09]
MSNNTEAFFSFMLSSLEKRVFEVIESNRETMIHFLRSLVNIDTQTPPGHNYDILCNVLADKYHALGCDTKIHEAPEKYLKLSGAKHMGLEGPRSNLVAKLKGVEKGLTMHVSAHTDTAAIQKEGWTVPPLSGIVTQDSLYGKSIHDRGGGYIWGRGVADDKGALAALTLAVEAIQSNDIKLKGDLIVTANCDEEIGGVAGLGYLIKEGIVKSDLGIQLDGSLSGIGLAAMGRTRFQLTTHGVSYHGQVPVLGVNAIEKMSKLNVALDDYWRNILLKRKAPVQGIDLGEGLRERGITDLTAMLNIGTIRGGVQGATVPDQCTEEVLRGMIPGETFEETHAEFKQVLDSVKGTDPDLEYTLDVINCRDGYVVPADDPYAISCQLIIEEATGKLLPFTGTLASTDMNYQVVDGGMKCVNFGVGGAYSNGHKQDENASIDEIIECGKAVALIIMRKLGVTT